LEFLIWADAWVGSWDHTQIDRKKRRSATEAGDQALQELKAMERKLGTLLRGDDGSR